MENTTDKIKSFIDRVDEMKKDHKLDLSSDQDLSIAIMNLVSIEEHFFFTGAKLEDSNYYDLIREVREMRKELLKKIVKDSEGEVWCISKHLLAASMRLMEVGTKELGRGEKDVAYDLFGKAYNLYSLFWGLNLKLINTDEVKKIDEGAISKSDPAQKSLPAGRQGLLGKLGELVKRAIDCCIE